MTHFAYAETPPLQLQDDTGRIHLFTEPPEHIVPLVPGVSDILIALGQEKRIAAMSRQELLSHTGLAAESLDSFFNPDFATIKRVTPDLIICPPKRTEQVAELLPEGEHPFVCKLTSLNECNRLIKDFGKLFSCEKRAEELIHHLQTQISVTEQRLANHPEIEKKRTVRLLATPGGDTLYVPGDDSFQNDMIRHAGGIPLQTGKDGCFVTVTPEELRDFAPQFVYGCEENEEAVRTVLQSSKYHDIFPVEQEKIMMFPCDMTCRISPQTGDFVAWLAAAIHPRLFADPEKAATEDTVLQETPLSFDRKPFPYLKEIKRVKYRQADRVYKTLVLQFATPQRVLSSFNGLLKDLDGCGNTFVPMEASYGQMIFGVDDVQKTIARNLGFAPERFTTLMTGATMDNLAVAQRSFKDIAVAAFVTAGIRGNAMRISRDNAMYLQHGTINIIIITNHRLSDAAMARSIITVTEAKTAALEDLDIRSTFTPLPNRATGTGTDSIIVVQGEGKAKRYAGGHDKIAQLIAEAVHEGVTKAIQNQNKLTANRSIVERLYERGCSLEDIAASFPTTIEKKQLVRRLEQLLGQSYYAGFIGTAFATADAAGSDLVQDGTFWKESCARVAASIAGKELAILPCSNKKLPPALASALGAILSGIQASEASETSKASETSVEFKQ